MKKYVHNWAKKNNLKLGIEFFHSAEAFDFSWSMDKRYNILFLDIEMSGINGIELKKKNKKKG